MSSTVIDRHFALRKLHSLLGLIPIGAFLMFHLFENSLAPKGAEYFTEHVVYKISHMRFVTIMEVCIIALPILFHGIYGVIMWFQGRANVGRYGYFRNWMYTLQRYTGIITFVFILTHVWETRMQVLLGNLAKEGLYAKMAQIFSTPLGSIWYAIGILCAVYHLTNGLWLMGITWGITIGPRSQKISSCIFAVVGLLLLALGGQALLGFNASAH
ncbi:MAG: succinate dehydrogenase [Candidatus Eisenbacteria bacterium]|uniref:Succinate dehydrogenase n=1 Tax=Eiseniibacteriota bacterium TaxID=2212470 RepID=A0A948W839_UNCEI|nr:succinate dehydrogenase [Candidatus Eisenbacteria bacterium]MBU1950681.1 succinate dehydrogenase [Candidatus Eisenbacteria bacterium]MBU2693264.1 succinate dehydrogenase [Candidatus Eisenbacteria bacterium]